MQITEPPHGSLNAIFVVRDRTVYAFVSDWRTVRRTWVCSESRTGVSLPVNPLEQARHLQRERCLGGTTAVWSPRARRACWVAGMRAALIHSAQLPPITPRWMKWHPITWRPGIGDALKTEFSFRHKLAWLLGCGCAESAEASHSIAVFW